VLIDGCAYCADMHTKIARSLGENGVAAEAHRRIAGVQA
jgi:AhpD family alkylhydroperoxidase